MLEKPKSWKSGVADEAWKVMICAKDAMRAKDLIQGVAYILDNPGHGDIRKYADVLRKFSGDQIADALLDYHFKAFVSVANALPEKIEKPDA